MNPSFDHQQISNAGALLFNVITGGIADERGVHLETAIAAAGYLAGTAMLRATGVSAVQSLPAGSPVLVDQVNESGPRVAGYMLNALDAAGPQTAGAPADMVPSENQPLQSYESLVRVLWDPFKIVLAKNSIPADSAALACANTAARLIVAGQEQLAPAIGKLIALEAMVKASKTVPPVNIFAAA